MIAEIAGQDPQQGQPDDGFRDRMITREDLKEQIWNHLEGLQTLEDLAAWAEDVFRTEEFEPEYADEISDILAMIRDAVDPHRFRWEEPDFEELLQSLSEEP